MDYNNKFEIEQEDEDVNVFSWFNVFYIYLPLMIYLTIMQYKLGFIKGFVAYFFTTPVLLLLAYLNIYNPFNKGLLKVTKMFLTNLFAFMFCIGIIYLLL